MKINLKPLLFWVLPILMSFLFELFFADFRWYNFQNLVENIIYLFSILIILSFIKNQKWKSILYRIGYLVFVMCLLLETSFFYLFSTFFSASSIFIFLETNLSETSEFLSLYIDSKLIIYSGILFFLIILFFLKRTKIALEFSSRYSTIFKIGIISLFVIGLKWSGFIIANFPFQVLKGSVSYIYETYKFSDLDLDQPIGDFEEVVFNGDSSAHTYILIIGESNARRQLGLYGYERETTPMLSKRKDELMIYKDVISSKAHTIESLQDALIFKDLDTQTESSVIQLMNQAGFKTFWLSNQRPIGIYETLLTKLSKASDHYVYTNTTRWGSVTPFDEVLFPHLDKALEDKASKKFIVINLLATHANYELRYPKEFDKFNSVPKTKFPSKKNFEVINHYHNSLSYVDFLVNTIIDKVKIQNDKSYVLYLSDHGEEVFYDRDFVGHNDSDIPTRSMFEIPFFLWTSTEFDAAYQFDFEAERPYILSDFIHSLSDLSRIKFSKLDTQKSIFSEDFKPMNRILGNDIDFDIYFEEDTIQ